MRHQGDGAAFAVEEVDLGAAGSGGVVGGSGREVGKGSCRAPPEMSRKILKR
jgi:hypothetical protein